MWWLCTRWLELQAMWCRFMAQVIIIIIIIINNAMHCNKRLCVCGPNHQVSTLTGKPDHMYLVLPVLMSVLLAKPDSLFFLIAGNRSFTIELYIALQVRLNFLATLIGEAYNHLHNHMCASVLGRKLFTLPFHRDVSITAAGARKMQASLLYCQQVSAAKH